MSIEIKDGVDHPASMRSQLLVTFAAMKVGQHIDLSLDGREFEHLRSQVYEAVHAHRKNEPGFKVTTEEQEDGQTVRVWRVANKPTI